MAFNKSVTITVDASKANRSLTELAKRFDTLEASSGRLTNSLSGVKSSVSSLDNSSALSDVDALTKSIQSLDKSVEKMGESLSRAKAPTKSFASEAKGASANVDRLSNSMRGAEKRSGNLTRVFGQVGFQIQDIAVQAQAGTDKLIILAQQGPQILGALGPVGAIAGAFVAVGAALGGSLAPALFDTTSQADKAKEVFEALSGSLEITDGIVTGLSSSLTELSKESRELAEIQLFAGQAQAIENIRNSAGAIGEVLEGASGFDSVFTRGLTNFSASIETARFQAKELIDTMGGIEGAVTRITEEAAITADQGIFRSDVASVVANLSENLSITGDQASRLFLNISQLQTSANAFDPVAEGSDQLKSSIEESSRGIINLIKEVGTANPEFAKLASSLGQTALQLLNSAKTAEEFQEAIEKIKEGLDIVPNKVGETNQALASQAEVYKQLGKAGFSSSKIQAVINALNKAGLDPLKNLNSETAKNAALLYDTIKAQKESESAKKKLATETARLEKNQKAANERALESVDALIAEREALEGGEDSYTLYKETKAEIAKIEESNLPDKELLIALVKEEAQAIIDLKKETKRLADEEKKRNKQFLQNAKDQKKALDDLAKSSAKIFDSSGNIDIGGVVGTATSIFDALDSGSDFLSVAGTVFSEAAANLSAGNEGDPQAELGGQVGELIGTAFFGKVGGTIGKFIGGQIGLGPGVSDELQGVLTDLETGVTQDVTEGLDKFSRENLTAAGQLNSASLSIVEAVEGLGDVDVTGLINAFAGTRNGFGITLNEAGGELRPGNIQLDEFVEVEGQTVGDIEAQKIRRKTVEDVVAEQGGFTTFNQLDAAGALNDLAEFLEEAYGVSLDVFRELADTGEDFSSAIARVNAGFLAISDVTEQLGLNFELTGEEGIRASDRLIDSLGGLPSAITGIDAFYRATRSAEEQRQDSIDAATESLAEFSERQGLTNDSVIDGADSARAFAESLDLTTAAGAAAFAELTSLSGQITILEEAIGSLSSVDDARQDYIDALFAERDALSDTADQFEQFAATLRQTQRDLRVDSSISALSPENLLAELESEFASVSARAALGDQDAVERLPTLSRELLEASKDYYGQSEGFYEDFDMVQSALDSAASTAERHIDIDREQLDVLNSQLEALGAIEGAINELTLTQASQQAANSLGQSVAGSAGQGSTASTGDLEDAVSALYTSGLGRAPDSEGLDFWVNQLQQPGVTYDQVKAGFFEAADQNNEPIQNRFALGGLVVGAGTGTSDSISAKLSNREFVMTASATSGNEQFLTEFNQSNGGNIQRAAEMQAEISASGFKQVVSALNRLDARLSDIEQQGRDSNVNTRGRRVA